LIFHRKFSPGIRFEVSEQVLARIEGGVGRLTLNRPEQRNAMSVEMSTLLSQRLRDMEQDAAIRCIVLDGAGKHFVAGGDIKAWGRLLPMSPSQRGEDFRVRLGASFPLIEQLESLTKPLVVAVRGYSVGAGLCFVLAADFVIADDTAKFLFASTKAALNPDMGLTYWLPRVVGARRAYRLALLGSQLGPAEAKDLGIVDDVVAPDALEDALAALTNGILATPSRAAMETKRLIRQSGHNTLAAQFSAEVDGIAACAGEADFVEAVSAFSQKRPPKFG
jgi:2-(1,2-epoxy-1,2-dihydrophenyl)acetyl-CoA isomerase